MKQLLILRHGETEMSAAANGDRGRRLTDKGRAHMQALGHLMADEGQVPDTILCSAAVRTRETVDCLLPAFEPAPNVQFEDQLYGADEDALLAHIMDAAPDRKSLLVVAHNPGVHGLIVALAGEIKEGVQTDPFVRGYPPGTLSVLTFDIETWREVAPHTGCLTYCQAPA